MVEALAAKNSEIEALVSSMDAHKKQAAISEGNLASTAVARSKKRLQEYLGLVHANMESIMRNRETDGDKNDAGNKEEWLL
ncbi:hypothetical protein M0R45_003407 [Rubus argutus]|uniref:Uncharacterized protein n=1 Tax=Rubus argutus TaxID=59490 RepID=A0AAW1YIK9_RUBAR